MKVKPSRDRDKICFKWELHKEQIWFFAFFRNSIHYIENIWINPNPGTFFAASFANMFKEFTIIQFTSIQWKNTWKIER